MFPHALLLTRRMCKLNAKILKLRYVQWSLVGIGHVVFNNVFFFNYNMENHSYDLFIL